MNRVLALLLIAAPSIALAGEQCVWPFRAAPAELTGQLRADLRTKLATLCPGRNQIAVTFDLKPGKTPSKVAVSAPACPKAEADLRRWFAKRPASDFLDYQKTQNVAFKIMTRFEG